MKLRTILTTIMIIGISASSFAQFLGEGSKQVFSSPNLKTEIYKHKTVAILPFNATISYKRMPKNFDAEGNKRDEQALSTGMQSGMYTYLLRKANDFSVSFQDIERTNILLKQKGIYDKINEITQDSICKALGVDAVVFMWF